ncbi:RhoGEF group protein [Pseudozyma hubeiensis SY62]|uniref:RhoGEF group protein n=1 Tax=Pseudozyma hubeiensis (strain SY62) TaxID=1305764 RepID=R9P8T4_PSEHS|nr:RhoGEF group protein [Pseudozyma hubeiensis SY62]GAC97788.1 RhoGEF group protein [Pseudozyma hubeiensis SY62]
MPLQSIYKPHDRCYVHSASPLLLSNSVPIVVLAIKIPIKTKMARPSFQDPSMATTEQVCMLGLYAVGASLLTTMHQTSPMVTDSLPSKIEFDRKSVDMHHPFPQKPTRASAKRARRSKREAKSLDLLSGGMSVSASQQPALRDFSFNANKLGITGDHLAADFPPSPLSSRVHLPPLQDESPRSKGWLSYLTPSWPRAQPSDEDSDDDDGALPHGPKGLKKQRSWSRLASLAAPSRREQRSASDPDTSATSSTYVPARLGQIPFLPREEDAAQKPRSRSMSLDVPRLARKSFSTLRSKRAPSAQPSPQAPQLGHLAFAQDQSYRSWNAPGMQAEFDHVLLRDLPRESTSSSESEYSYDRRHSISGSSGHEALHARARGDSQGSFPSTAPSTVSDTAVMSSAFSVSDTQRSDSEGEESDDDEDDIEWERPEAIRPACTSPIDFEHVPASPTATRSSGRRSFQMWSQRPRLPSFASNAKSPSKNSTKSSLGGPRRMTSASSLGGKSEQSGRSSLSELARRSFSQARTLLLVPSPRSAARRSVAGDDTTRPAAVFLQPINTGVISRPCQTTPNPVASTRSNSMTMTCSTTNTIEGSSVRYPSFYLGTSSESGSVTGGSSGNSSGGRSWESTAPELAALEELVLTECKYLADLQLLLDVYVEGLRRLDLITPASLEKIVSNLDEVMVLSKFLIDTVREYLPRRMSPPTSISSQPGNSDSSSRPHAPPANRPLLSEPDYLGLSSKLVKELPARMEVYARYCVLHHEAKERLAFERDLRPAVATFIELTRSTNPTLQGMDMDQFLVLPVQRVTRYPLLFGCLAKECGKRRSESDELREEDEDTDMAAYNVQRQGRADAICSNWTRLRDVSASICGLTNLAISYQQHSARPDTTRSRPRPSMSVSSPLLSSPSNAARFGPMQTSTPPPPALVMREQGSSPRPAPPLTTQEAKPRLPAFWRRSSTKTSDKTQTDSTGVSSTSSESSGGSSSSLLTRFVKAFRHPAP